MNLKDLKRASKVMNSFLRLNEKDKIDTASKDEEYLKAKLVEAGNLVEEGEEKDVSELTRAVLGELGVPLFEKFILFVKKEDGVNEEQEESEKKEEPSEDELNDKEENSTRNKKRRYTRFKSVCDAIKNGNNSIDELVRLADSYYTKNTNGKSNENETKCCLRITIDILDFFDLLEHSSEGKIKIKESL